MSRSKISLLRIFENHLKSSPSALKTSALNNSLVSANTFNKYTSFSSRQPLSLQSRFFSLSTFGAKNNKILEALAPLGLDHKEKIRLVGIVKAHSWSWNFPEGLNKEESLAFLDKILTKIEISQLIMEYNRCTAQATKVVHECRYRDGTWASYNVCYPPRLDYTYDTREREVYCPSEEQVERLNVLEKKLSECKARIGNADEENAPYALGKREMKVIRKGYEEVFRDGPETLNWQGEYYTPKYLTTEFCTTKYYTTEDSSPYLIDKENSNYNQDAMNAVAGDFYGNSLLTLKKEGVLPFITPAFQAFREKASFTPSTAPTCNHS